VKRTAKNKKLPIPAPRKPSLSSLGERQIFVFGMVCLVVGVLLGYLIRGLAPTTTAASAVASPAAAKGSAPPAPAALTPTLRFDEVAAPLEAALKSNPKDLALLIRLGNLYSDHRVLAKAIEYYTRALNLDPKNVKVRTDLGSVYWYSGFPDKAVMEYKKSLSVDPSHYQTLFNLGMVYENGFNDHAQAISTWEKLVQIYPQNPNREQVERLIESATKKASAPKSQ
jgi:cytochrome c-type biogenesis protein CcmH/NrfG